jgi:hypothetical protein
MHVVAPTLSTLDRTANVMPPCWVMGETLRVEKPELYLPWPWEVTVRYRTRMTLAMVRRLLNPVRLLQQVNEYEAWIEPISSCAVVTRRLPPIEG